MPTVEEELRKLKRFLHLLNMFKGVFLKNSDSMGEKEIFY